MFRLKRSPQLKTVYCETTWRALWHEMVNTGPQKNRLTGDRNNIDTFYYKCVENIKLYISNVHM